MKSIHDGTPSEWFNQFPSNPAMDGHEQWCARHWAPCPNLGANGIGAFTELMQIFINEFASDAKTPGQLNKRMGEIGRICCALGDERMYEVWSHWPPSAESRAERRT